LGSEKYYSKLKPIEYYSETELNMNLENDHKLSTGEPLIVLILWRQCHAHFEDLRIFKKIFKQFKKKLKVLLLDEPDSYMYPMRLFIDLFYLYLTLK